MIAVNTNDEKMKRVRQLNSFCIVLQMYKYPTASTLGQCFFQMFDIFLWSKMIIINEKHVLYLKQLILVSSPER